MTITPSTPSTPTTPHTPGAATPAAPDIPDILHVPAPPKPAPFLPPPPAPSPSIPPDAAERLLSLLLHHHFDLSAAFREFPIPAPALLTLLRNPAFADDLAQLREFCMLAAHLRALHDLRPAQDPISPEQRRACSAILRATDLPRRAPAHAVHPHAAHLRASTLAPAPAATHGPRPLARSSGAHDVAPTPAAPARRARRIAAVEPHPLEPAPLEPTPLDRSSAPELLLQLVETLSNATDEAPDDAADDQPDADPRDHAFLRLHEAFTGDEPVPGEHPPEACPAGAEVAPGAAALPDAQVDGQPVPLDPAHFLESLSPRQRDDLADFPSFVRYVEEDQDDTLYSERLCFTHPDRGDVFRRFIFRRAAADAPWRLAVLEPYRPEDLDADD